MGRTHPTKARLSLTVWTVQIWIIPVTVQNLYGSLVFRMVKTIFAILFPAAVSAFL